MTVREATAGVFGGLEKVLCRLKAREQGGNVVDSKILCAYRTDAFTVILAYRLDSSRYQPKSDVSPNTS